MKKPATKKTQDPSFLEKTVVPGQETYSKNGRVAGSTVTEVPPPSKFYERNLQAQQRKVQEELAGVSDNMPPLPNDAKLDPDMGLGVGRFLDDYTEFAEEESPSSPKSYNVNGALWTLTTASARRPFVKKGGRMHPSLNYLNMGQSSMYAKTEASKIAQGLLVEAGLSELVITSKITPQKLITNMTLKIPENYLELPQILKDQLLRDLAFRAQRGAYWDELGRRLHNMADGRSVYSGTYDLILQLYDCPGTLISDTQVRGAEEVKEPFLPILGNGTPDNVRKLASKDSEAWGDGLLPRFGIACPPMGEKVSYKLMPFRDRTYPAALINPIKAWHQRLGIPIVEIVDLYEGVEDKKPYYQVEHMGLPAHELTIPQNTQDLYANYRIALIKIIENQTQDGASFHLAATYARLPDSALKVAMLLASLDGLDHIPPTYFAKGQGIAEMWREGAHNLSAHVEASGSKASKYSRRNDEDKVIKVIQKLIGEGEQPTVSRIRARTSLSYDEVKRLCGDLVSNEVLTAQEYKPARGKTGTAYYWTGN